MDKEELAEKMKFSMIMYGHVALGDGKYLVLTQDKVYGTSPIEALRGDSYNG